MLQAFIYMRYQPLSHMDSLAHRFSGTLLVDIDITIGITNSTYPYLLGLQHAVYERVFFVCCFKPKYNASLEI
jgi:hypothetical protein